MKASSRQRKERLEAALRVNLRRRKKGASKVRIKPKPREKPASPEMRREEATNEN